MVRRSLACALILTITWTGWAWAAGPALAQQAPGQVSQEEGLAKLEELMDALEELRSHIDRSQFDLEALLEKLDYDADKIVGFVKGEIYFEQYPGLLRGAQGTLMSRAGNALDQSLLLATLLKDAGFEARIGQGRLDPALADELLSRVALDRGEPSPIGDLARIQPIMEELEGIGGLDGVSGSIAGSSRSGDTSAAERAERLASAIQEDLARQEITLDPSPILASIRQETRDYFWVEHRDGPSDGWQVCHVAFGDGAPDLRDVEIGGYLADSVPEELQFKLRIESFIVQKLGSDLIRKAIMDPWERPAANLLGIPLSLSLVPDTLLDEKALLDFPAALQGARFFLPLLNSRLAPGALAFDLQGNTVPPDALSGGAAALFQEFSAKTESAVAALGDLGSAAPPGGHAWDPVALMQVQHVFTLVHPGGESTAIHRTVFDRELLPGPIDGAAEVDRAWVSQISSDHSIMSAVGEYPEAYVTERVVSGILQYRPLLERIQQDSHSTPEEMVELVKAELAKLDTAWAGHLPLFAAFDESARRFANGSMYRSQPNLTGYISRFRPDGTRTGSIDVISNARRALRDTEEGLTFAAAGLVEAGVAESVAETFGGQTDLATPKSGVGVLDLSLQRKVYRHVLVPGMKAQKLPPGLSPLAQNNLQRDLDAGYLVIVPDPEFLVSASSEAWWRIDPHSGETLAILGDGSGGAPLTEEMVVLLGIAGALILVAGIFQLVQCLETGGDMICITCSILTVLFGMATVVMAFVDVMSVGATIPIHIVVYAALAAALKEVGCSALVFHNA